MCRTVRETETWKSEVGQEDAMRTHSLSLGINAKRNQRQRVSPESLSGKWGLEPDCPDSNPDPILQCWGQFLSLSESKFPHLYNGHSPSASVLEWILVGIRHWKLLAQSWAQKEFPVSTRVVHVVLP